MKRVRTQLDLEATPEEAWAVLSDTSTWPDWNPVIPKIDADPWVGGKLRFEIHVAPHGPMTLGRGVRITRWDEARGLAWGGGLPGIFTGEHYFRLEPTEGGACRIVHGEDFAGLVPQLFLGRKRLAEIETAYARMNDALAAELARRAEHRDAGSV